MTDERILGYARRIANRFVDVEIGAPAEYPERAEYLTRLVLPILQEAIAESVEDHMVSVPAASKGGPA